MTTLAVMRRTNCFFKTLLYPRFGGVDKTAIQQTHGCLPRIFTNINTRHRLYCAKSGQGGDQTSGTRWSWKLKGSLLLLCGLGIGNAVYIRQFLKELKDVTVPTQSVGTPLVGGEWDLMDHHGKMCTSRDFKGQWLLMYFGFTHCPDICPDELDKLVEAMAILDKDTSIPKVKPIFVTIDPARDSPDVIAQYVKDFSPDLLGLTGSQDQIDRVTKAYRVYHYMGPKDEDNDYLVDHSIITYLVGPDGKYVKHYGRSVTAQEMADDVQKQIKNTS